MTTTRQWLDLPLTALEPAPWRLHDRDDLVTRAKLAASLEHHGQVQALVVRAMAGGAYEVVDGRVRLELMRALGWETAHCCVLASGLTRDAGPRVALSLQLEQRVSYPAVAVLVRDLSGGYDTDREAWAALARTVPFTPDDLRYFVALLDFDWERFKAEPEPQALLDWDLLEAPPADLAAPPATEPAPAVPMPLPAAWQPLVAERVVLPAVPGHSHAFGADGRPTCGCRLPADLPSLAPLMPGEQAAEDALARAAAAAALQREDEAFLALPDDPPAPRPLQPTYTPPAPPPAQPREEPGAQLGLF